MEEVDRHRLVGEPAAFVEFGLRTQIDDRHQPEPTHGFAVAIGEAVQPVGTEQRAPPSGGTVARRVATEVSEVVHRIEPDEPTWVVEGEGDGDIGVVAARAVHEITVPSDSWSIDRLPVNSR
jgi:hypothetical protein